MNDSPHKRRARLDPRSAQARKAQRFFAQWCKRNRARWPVAEASQARSKRFK